MVLAIVLVWHQEIGSACLLKLLKKEEEVRIRHVLRDNFITLSSKLDA